MDEFTSREISEKYNRFAPWYDFVEGIPEVLGIRRLRKRVLAQAEGDVLEVSAGTGKNFYHYPPVERLIASDISEGMLRRARTKAAWLPSLGIVFLIADGAALPFGDRTFDTVVSTLTVCTFPEPRAALREMSRVCRPDGQILLIEHGRSDRERLARFQDRRAEGFARQLGCHWNREPLELVRQAGLRVASARRMFFGAIHVIEALPANSAIASALDIHA